MPVIAGSTTHKTETAAIAASAALPPAFMVSMAARLAAGCDVVHIARRAWTVERPGRWKSRIVLVLPNVSVDLQAHSSTRRLSNLFNPYLDPIVSDLTLNLPTLRRI